MPETLSFALQITLIGISLVFGSILLLWIAIAALVRLAADRPSDAAQETSTDDRELKRRAAVAGVAVALARQAAPQPGVLRLPPTAAVSAWQAVMRGRQLKQQGPVR